MKVDNVSQTKLPIKRKILQFIFNWMQAKIYLLELHMTTCMVEMVNYEIEYSVKGF